MTIKVKKHRPDEVKQQISSTQKLRYQKIREGLRRIAELDNIDDKISRICNETIDRYFRKNIIMEST